MQLHIASRSHSGHPVSVILLETCIHIHLIEISLVHKTEDRDCGEMGEHEHREIHDIYSRTVYHWILARIGKSTGGVSIKHNPKLVRENSISHLRPSLNKEHK